MYIIYVLLIETQLVPKIVTMVELTIRIDEMNVDLAYSLNLINDNSKMQQECT